VVTDRSVLIVRGQESVNRVATLDVIWPTGLLSEAHVDQLAPATIAVAADF